MAAVLLIRSSCSRLHVYPKRLVGPAFFSTSSANRGRLFTEKHEWVLLDGTSGTVGISNYAQEHLGDVVYAQLPDVGTEVTQGGECGTVESVKAVSEVYSPVSGTVLEKNTSVEDDPSLINKSCYDKGWLFKIKLKTPEELKKLLDEVAYEKFVKSLDVE